MKPKKLNNNQAIAMFEDMINDDLKRLGRYQIGQYVISVNMADEKLTQAEKSKLKRQRWKLKGLCTNCGDEREDKKLNTCEKCRARFRGRWQKK